jgi:hypothetical protein
VRAENLMRPHDVGFDEFYGYYPAAKELTQQLDKRRYPDLVLNRARGSPVADPGLQSQKDRRSFDHREH